ncbi:MAG: DUF1553 domain-containing protein [Gemmataceae bacterium]
MRFGVCLRFSSLALGPSVVDAQAKLDPKHVEFFESKIRPVLVEQCYSCHSAEAKKVKGKLLLDTRDAMSKGGETGVLFVSGDPEKSLLIHALKHQNDVAMPPGKKLPEAVIRDFETWVKLGAPDPRDGSAAPAPAAIDWKKAREHWAFQPVTKPTAPKVNDAAWPKNDIDRFVLQQLEKAGLKPVATAGKREWLRRATFDLIGLPPTPEEVETFLKDESAEAYAKVVDRLLQSPHYGERWARTWLDLSRYAEDQAHTFGVQPFTNAFRYRDWVVDAFNKDMPFDRFLKLQLAGDLMPPEPDRVTQLAGLGFQGLGVLYYKNTDAAKAAADELDDRIDMLTRAVLGLTVSCARCHDHKFDPIPQLDYFSLAGVFNGSSLSPLAIGSEDHVKKYDEAQKTIKSLTEKVETTLKAEAEKLSLASVAELDRYLLAAWQVQRGTKAADVAIKHSLHAPTLNRWVAMLGGKKEIAEPFAEWRKLAGEGSEPSDAMKKYAADMKAKATTVAAEFAKLDAKKRKQLETPAKTNGKDRPVMSAEKDVLAIALLATEKSPHRISVAEARAAMPAERRQAVEKMEADLDATKKSSPPAPPMAHVLKGGGAAMKVHLRGNPAKQGDLAPLRFLQVVGGESTPTKYTRLELAEDIASPKNPLTARVFVNRLWLHHFGRGLVTTPSNFGTLGDRPTHPELLDWLASRFMESGWSVKAMHREIMLSATYRLAAANDEKNFGVDGDNRFYWRTNRRRLEVESWRDAMLAVSGQLDPTIGGPTIDLGASNNRRRTIYGKISRHELNPMLRMFDFPDANITSERRTETTVPQQQLFVLNGSFVVEQAKALAARLQKQSANDAERVKLAFELLYARPATAQETEAAVAFLKEADPPMAQNRLTRWERLAQVFLASNEFMYLD